MCSSQLDRGYGVLELMQNQRLRPKSRVYTVLVEAFKINNRSFNIKLFASITRSDAELEALYRVAPDPDHIAPEQLPLPSACGGWSGAEGLPIGNSNVQSHDLIVKRAIITSATFNLLLVL